jgi:hypothetical protein
MRFVGHGRPADPLDRRRRDQVHRARGAARPALRRHPARPAQVRPRARRRGVAARGGLRRLLADCRKLLDADSRFLVLTVYAVRMSALAIGELVKQALGDLGGTVEWARWRCARKRAGCCCRPRSSRAGLRSGRPDRGAGDERRAGDEQQRHRRLEQQRARSPAARSTPRRRSAAARPAAAAAGRRARRRAAGRRSARRRDGQRGEAGRADRQAELGRAARRRPARQQRRAGIAASISSGAEAQPVAGDLGEATLSSLSPRSASWSSTPSARSGSTSRSIGSSAAVSAAIHKRAAADPREQPRVGPDRERDQGRDQQEEDERQPAPPAEPRRSSRRISAPIIRPSSSLRQSPAERLVRGGEDRAAAARCRRSIRASRSSPSASRPLSGSSSSHSGAPEATTRASVARLRWPVDSIRTGTSASGRGPSPPSPARVGAVEPRPEAERLPSGSSRSSASARRPARAPPRSTVPRSARSSPAASRIRLDLPLPLGPVTSAASPGRARGRAPRTAAARRAAGDAPRAAAAAHSGRFLERVHVVVGEAEMVADLVDDDVGDQRLEADPGLRPFVERRPV